MAAWCGVLLAGLSHVLYWTVLHLWPQEDETPVPAEALGGYQLVFDAVYTPLHTRLLRQGPQRMQPLARLGVCACRA